MNKNARYLATQALVRVHQGGGYSNAVLDLLLSDEHSENTMSSADRALISRLFYGVLERLLTLDYIIEQHSSVRIKKMHPVVRELLRLGCYQLIYMDKIPASAAVNETVKLARSMKQDKAAGFINAVLRAVERHNGHLLDNLADDEQGLSVRTSCPVQLIRLWSSDYGDDMAVLLAESANQTPPVTIRLNTFKIKQKEFEDILEKSAIEFTKHPFISACYDIKDVVGLKRLAELPENCYYHQDKASQICCMALGAEPGERVADVCAAPGGKSLTLAQLMENEGEILAGEINPSKCDAMERRINLAGATNIITVVRDASKPCPSALIGKFDRVLCDVPCSGFGAIRRKPEIRYKPIESFASIPELQLSILNESANMVRRGGVLQYSTCTLNKAENEQVANRFLSLHPEFSPRILPLEDCFLASGGQPSYQITLFPPIHGTDGFYIAGFTKNEETAEMR
ncbi:MAG: 16S rRNA (cytosine(967)-C(5))-methyltransferase RsmB [Oscillospiraceae bacterium]|nr:16S rRNA (cytosine(967)-C(5))-methyltransferase RsmB [Oscillospiraceae bacterium]MDD3832298.1 16S rRNA (cytosine(967)-C(5))-methyltransferase RsmB [Oscillospiraceae bacterium]MDD4546095.1 16S rRNA (cytosine(967)-C(5))-methyltransferase RsmB [Oscillospiraceae bacterium]